MHRAEAIPRSRFAQQLELEPEEPQPGLSGEHADKAAYDAMVKAAR